MRTKHYSLLCLLIAMSVWACLVSEDLSGSYTLLAIEGQVLPAPVPNTQFEVTSGSLQLSGDGSFLLSYVTYNSTNVSASFTAELGGTYDSRNEPTIGFNSTESTRDGSSVPKPEDPFFGTVHGDSLTLTDPNEVRWLFRRADPQ